MGYRLCGRRRRRLSVWAGCWETAVSTSEWRQCGAGGGREGGRSAATPQCVSGMGRFTLYSIPTQCDYTLYIMYRTPCTTRTCIYVLYAVYYMVYTVHYVLYTVHYMYSTCTCINVLYAVYYMVYTVHYVLYTVHYMYMYIIYMYVLYCRILCSSSHSP